MSSTTKVSIENIPYDVLREIFIHCVPKTHRITMQPDVKASPMLLCQVCSPWRRVALMSATLWTHLAFSIPIVVNEDEDSDEGDPPWVFLKAGIDFIKWWKNNHRAIPPYLNFTLCNASSYARRRDLTHEHLVSAHSGLEFIVAYLTSAQYLSLDSFLWYGVKKRIDAGDQISFPNLRTIVDIRRGSTLSITDTIPFQFLDNMLQPNGEPILNLRSLYLLETRFTYLSTIPNHWSTLTHLCLWNPTITDGYMWLSIISIVRNLQWGCFKFNKFNFTSLVEPDAPPIVLSELTTLIVLVDIPLDVLFTYVHLPALRTLTLDGKRGDWTQVIADLSLMFKSAPNVTDMHLGVDFLRNALSTALTSTSSTPFDWSNAPHLVHLELDPPPGFNLPDFIRYIFAVDELGNNGNACPIRKITLSTTSQLGRSYDVVELPDLEFATTKLNLEIVTGDISAIAREAYAWREWRS